MAHTFGEHPAHVMSQTHWGKAEELSGEILGIIKSTVVGVVLKLLIIEFIYLFIAYDPVCYDSPVRVTALNEVVLVATQYLVLVIIVLWNGYQFLFFWFLVLNMLHTFSSHTPHMLHTWSTHTALVY